MFKKIITILSSHLLSFALGIALMAGIGYVSASYNWNNALPSHGTTPDRLSRENWEAIVHGIKNIDKIINLVFNDLNLLKALTRDTNNKIKVMENTISKEIGVTVLSAKSSYDMALWEAVQYCENLIGAPEFVLDGSSKNISYTDWRLPTISEAVNFIAFFPPQDHHATREYITVIPPVETGHSSFVELSAGSAGSISTGWKNYVRCVR